MDEIYEHYREVLPQSVSLFPFLFLFGLKEKISNQVVYVTVSIYHLVVDIPRVSDLFYGK